MKTHNKSYALNVIVVVLLGAIFFFEDNDSEKTDLEEVEKSAVRERLDEFADNNDVPEAGPQSFEVAYALKEDDGEWAEEMIAKTDEKIGSSRLNELKAIFAFGMWPRAMTRDISMRRMEPGLFHSSRMDL